jgi:hypothetical protein
MLYHTELQHLTIYIIQRLGTSNIPGFTHYATNVDRALEVSIGGPSSGMGGWPPPCVTSSTGGTVACCVCCDRSPCRATVFAQCCSLCTLRWHRLLLGTTCAQASSNKMRRPTRALLTSYTGSASARRRKRRSQMKHTSNIRSETFCTCQANTHGKSASQHPVTEDMDSHGPTCRTWAHMDSHGPTWTHMTQWPHMRSHGPTCVAYSVKPGISEVASLCICRYRGVAARYASTWAHMDSHGAKWTWTLTKSMPHGSCSELWSGRGCCHNCSTGTDRGRSARAFAEIMHAADGHRSHAPCLARNKQRGLHMQLLHATAVEGLCAFWSL